MTSEGGKNTQEKQQKWNTPQRNTNKYQCVEMNLNTASQQCLCCTTRGHQQLQVERREGRRQQVRVNNRENVRQSDIKTQKKKMLQT